MSALDISDDVNAQVSAVGGEVVIRLSVTVDGGCNLLNIFPVLNIVPVWPGCVPVTITGWSSSADLRPNPDSASRPRL